jgi:hypothetical protein
MFTSFNVEKVLAIGDTETQQSQVVSEKIKIPFTQLMIELFGGFFVFKTLDYLVTKIIDSTFERYIR